jgi:hypothetical protein
MGSYQVWFTTTAFISDFSHRIQLSIWILNRPPFEKGFTGLPKINKAIKDF